MKCPSFSLPTPAYPPYLPQLSQIFIIWVPYRTACRPRFFGETVNDDFVSCPISTSRLLRAAAPAKFRAVRYDFVLFGFALIFQGTTRFFSRDSLSVPGVGMGVFLSSNITASGARIGSPRFALSPLIFRLSAILAHDEGFFRFACDGLISPRPYAFWVLDFLSLSRVFHSVAVKTIVASFQRFANRSGRTRIPKYLLVFPGSAQRGASKSFKTSLSWVC